MPRASKLLPSIGHAASGAGGTVVSTLATYPLDLVNTRLKVQRQLRADGSIGPVDGYRGILDAFASIYAKEGGIAAFFAGLGADVGKSAADSFLFFLFYTWFRARRLVARSGTTTPHLLAAEELAIGAAAGACAKLFTTPISNVVTRRQTASLLDASSGPNQETASQRDLTFGQVISEIRKERGLLGLWAGYSASLVLTLNPSLTFFLQQILKRALVPRERWDEPGASTTFILAALSKVAATSVTYPFQIAKARVQVSAAPEDGKRKTEEIEKDSCGSLVRDTIFATLVRIVRAEGVDALYDGIGGELLKGFFSHGTTMLSKDVMHRFILQLYFAILAALKGYPRSETQLSGRLRNARDEMRKRYLRASSLGSNEASRGARDVKDALERGRKIVASLSSGS
ncbi:Peroxisomal adenine nucleotide transporter 1 [Madurella mycetomatis]|uniref:Peroxisomal adenine nucleotide transporter 1 n=1 Tax=Madurella mycetomatis TaxID=100816 RepID=A0A175VT42_9PEZI|nr:Peroxisomal adenine nucleotide transporter 1 [Madurella mycetomatis]